MCPQHHVADHGSQDPPDPSMPAPEPRFDAGTKQLDHYAQTLPRWRHLVRQQLIPIVRWETPYLALMQETLRSPSLDSYFAFTANLGTHTFFMIMLPILFWCGYTSTGRAMVHMLAAGVFFTGVIKDLLCLPRPLSPPLARITMSGSVALEYGFPSTHSANAISVVIYVLDYLRSSPNTLHPTMGTAIQFLFYFYAVSIIFGRLYCGMHGFFDVVIGSLMGAGIAAVQLLYGERFDMWITSTSYLAPLAVILVFVIAVRIHPEPADDCPCFDDTLAFVGVVMGIQVGAWHYALTGYATEFPMPSTVPFDLESIGLFKASLRIVVGVVGVFAWRAVAKPTLLKVLPPLFRVLEHASLNLPRAFFLNASQYTNVPQLHGDDNVIPPASELPHMLKNLAHPRKRSVSIGPQSAADAYETLAYRNRRRRESINSLDGAVPENTTWSPAIKEKEVGGLKPQSNASSHAPLGVGLLPTPISSRVHSYEQMMGSGRLESTTITPPEMDEDYPGGVMQSPVEAENERRELFMKLTKPRVRYDVEVVTKLIVYAGIGWVAVEGVPLLLEVVGLGMPRS
ncbi:PAP2-domain-containing protein [Amniculicola lignicola CBS 123094]|uniref:PAP2-domain-containing protein n=1 Tax=Amniculicola lignicola CBS 123094 TaxID=1392246 RepID=A0A6A5W0H8_9PLEO|nr:PAP2-domain-containing protein [Amniculicola lignicola CBS 123094]